MNADQCKELKSAISNWPEETGREWEKCAIGFLCEKAGIPLPPEDLKARSLFPLLETHYGLPANTSDMLMLFSVDSTLSGKSKSRVQKEVLKEFLQQETIN